MSQNSSVQQGNNKPDFITNLIDILNIFRYPKPNRQQIKGLFIIAQKWQNSALQHGNIKPDFSIRLVLQNSSVQQGNIKQVNTGR